MNPNAGSFRRGPWQRRGSSTALRQPHRGRRSRRGSLGGIDRIALRSNAKVVETAEERVGQRFRWRESESGAGRAARAGGCGTAETSKLLGARSAQVATPGRLFTSVVKPHRELITVWAPIVSSVGPRRSHRKLRSRVQRHLAVAVQDEHVLAMRHQVLVQAMDSHHDTKGERVTSRTACCQL